MNFQSTEAVDMVLGLRRWEVDTMYRVIPAEVEAMFPPRFTTSPRAIRAILDPHRSTRDLEVGFNFLMQDTTTYEGSCKNRVLVTWALGAWFWVRLVDTNRCANRGFLVVSPRCKIKVHLSMELCQENW
jgi:hypothetical protein